MERALLSVSLKAVDYHHGDEHRMVLLECADDQGHSWSIPFIPFTIDASIGPVVACSQLHFIRPERVMAFMVVPH